jgi:hypothetical protein
MYKTTPNHKRYIANALLSGTEPLLTYGPLTCANFYYSTY